jgi:GAF domain-containing protein
MTSFELRPLALDSSEAERHARYGQVLEVIASLLDGEDDWIAAMATVCAELHGAFDYFDWTGFYRLKSPDTLVIGPYQGGHGCLRIRVPEGVCGVAVSTRSTQIVADVSAFAGHIACSSATESEIVVPIVSPGGQVLGVLDIDSNQPAAFGPVDGQWLERLCADLGRRFEHLPAP